MVGKSSEVMECLSAVLTLVNAVSPVCLNVCSQVVTSGVPLSADVARERLLTGVNPHVPAEMCGSDETVVTHLAQKRAIRFLFLLAKLVLAALDHLFLFWHVVRVNEIDELDCVFRRTAIRHLHTGS